jgi:hypothetical protein
MQGQQVADARLDAARPAAPAAFRAAHPAPQLDRLQPDRCAEKALSAASNR